MGQPDTLILKERKKYFLPDFPPCLKKVSSAEKGNIRTKISF
jgi:hypothetical protein